MIVQDISDYIFVEWKHDSQWPGFLRCAILPIRGDRGGDLTKYFVQRRNKTETTPEGDIIVVKVWQELEAPETLKYRETAVCPHYEGTNEKPDYNPYFPSHNRTWKNNEGFDQREKDPASYDISDPLTPTNMMATLKATNQRTANNVLQRWLLDLRLALIAFKDNLTGPGGPESHFSPPLLPSHDQIPPDLKPESKAKKGKGPVAGGAQEDSPLPDPPTAPLPTLAVQQATGSKRHGAAQKGSAGLQPSLEDDKHVVGAVSSMTSSIAT